MARTRIRLLPLCLLALGAFDCAGPNAVPEPGAALVRVTLTSAAPRPDELRVWAYDDTGRLWDAVRVPGTGALPSGSGVELGTILIQPGPLTGALRVHVRAFMTGVRVLDGVLTIPPADLGHKMVPIALDAAILADDDADDVPDVIDDCEGLPNPAQGGCPVAADAGASDDAADADATALDGPDDAGLGGAGGGGTDANGDVPGEQGAGGARGAGGAGGGAGRDAGADAAAGAMGDAGMAPDAADAGDAGDASDARTGTTDAGASDGGAGGCDGAGACGKAQGATCTRNTDCASGACADGVCCTNACTGPCRSCNQPSATGVCQPYAMGTDPETNCTNGATCNGAGACGNPPPPSKGNGQTCGGVTECRSGFCKDGVCCDTACTGQCLNCATGTCKAVTKAPDPPECSGFLSCNSKGYCI